MKKRGKSLKSLFVLLFAFGIAFLFKVPTVYADSPHEFSFKFYDCDSVDESKLTDVLNTAGTAVKTKASVECYGPNGDGVTPEIQPTNVTGVGSVYKFEPGKIVKVGVHYVPGTVTDVGIGVKFFFDNTSYTPVYWSKYASKTWSDKLAYTLNSDFIDVYKENGWTETVNHPTNSQNKITMAFADSSGGGTTMEDEMDIIWFYFRTLDEATTNEGLEWTFDTSKTGISLSTKAPFTVTDAKTYIEVPLSEDNTLGTLSVTSGSTEYILDPEFTPGDTETDSYTVVVPNNISSVNISATAKDAPRAVLSGDTGNHTGLGVGNNEFTLTVLSEAGVPKDYTINVYRLNNIATLSALNLTNVSYGTFSPGTTSYTATVPYTTSSTNVSATPTPNTNATVASGTGNKDLSVGSNPVSVRVNAENCKSQYNGVPGNTCTYNTYTVTVTRTAPSTISYLSDLTTDGTTVNGFQSGDGTKSYDDGVVGYDKADVIIGYEPGQENQTVTGYGTKTLNEGNNSFPVVVTAQDGSTKTTYTINIYKKSGNANLSSLTATAATGGSINFSPNTTNYTYNVGADENEVTITATAAAGNKATVKIYNANNQEITNGKVNPQTSGSIKVTVTPEDEDAPTKDYTVTFNIALSTNADLSGITVNGTSVPNFSADKTLYEVTVPTNIDTATIVASKADDRSTVVITPNDDSLGYGENIFTITVTPEDPQADAKTYTVKVTRTKKNISNLNDLTVDGNTVPEFHSNDPSETRYTIPAYDYSKSKVNIGYEKGDDDETVDGTGNNISVDVGSSTKTVTVTAQNGTDKTIYYIDFYRKSNDAKLSSLVLTAETGGSINFQPGTTSYTYNVGADEDEVTISATPNHPNATYKIYDANNQEITNGKVNPQTSGSVTVRVTPEDTKETKKDYVITFNIAKSTNVDLSNLTLDGTQISGFASDKTLYEINVDKDTDSVIIAASLADSRASFDSTINDQGTQVLDYGLNEFKIKVNPEDTTADSRTYTIKITRAYKTDAEFINIKVDDVDVPGFDPTDEDGTHYDLGSVKNNKQSVVITVEKHDDDATVSGDGEQQLNEGDNSLPVTITAQDTQTTKTYYIDIRRQSNANSLATLTITSDPAGTWSQSFDPAITGYTYTTGPDVTEVTISATVPDGSGANVVSGTGTYNPAETDTVTIRVEAEDGTPREYVINLVRLESSNANLDLLQVEGYDAFDLTGGEDHFTLTVPSTTSKVNIIAHAADAPRASLTGDGEKNVDFGDNPFTVTVTPENPEAPSKVYYITITRSLKNNARFSDLTADGVTVPEFDPDDPDNTEYDLGTLTDNNKTKILIGASAEDGDVVSITGTGNLDVNYGDNIYPVTITAQDGTTTLTYKVKVRKPFADSTLTGLEIQADTNGSLDKDFEPGETDYVYTSDPDEDEITIVVTPATGATATIVDHPDGKINPQDGPEEVLIIVQAENGDITNYTITVQRGLSSNGNLDSLEVEGYDPFDLTTGETHFTLNVDEDVDEVNIIAHAEDEDRVKSIEGDGVQTVNYGSNPFTVTVTAENDEPTYYYITINRALSSNVTLSDLKVEGETIDGFDPNDPSYDYGTVPNDVTSLDVEAIAAGADDGATVEVTGNDPLEVGENTITITVTAPDGETTGTYTITVTREANADNTLFSLQVEGFDPFDLSEGADHFEITIPNAQDSVNVIAVMNAPDTSTITGDGLHENLEVGENEIPVTVTAENNVPKTYTIVVTREAAEEPDELITSQVRTIADGYIKDVVYKSLPEQLKDDCDNENWKLHIFKIEKVDEQDVETEVSDSQKLGTGMIIKLIKNDRVNDSDILVVKGEITGDGLIKVGDIVAVVNNYLDADASPLEGAYFLAADMDNNGTIKVGDIVAIVNKYLED